jgi:hypothetical protein
MASTLGYILQHLDDVDVDFTWPGTGSGGTSTGGTFTGGSGGGNTVVGNPTGPPVATSFGPTNPSMSADRLAGEIAKSGGNSGVTVNIYNPTIRDEEEFKKMIDDAFRRYADKVTTRVRYSGSIR